MQMQYPQILTIDMDIKIYIPSFLEQEKIGNYFQKLDALINQHQQQIIKPPNLTSNNTTDQTSEEKEWITKKKMCHFWRRGKCNKGSQCKYDHPRECEEFLKFGLQKYRQDGKGCHHKCEKVHPFLCKSSFKYGKCGYQECKYRHTSTTKVQVRFQTNYTSSNNSNPSIPFPQKQHHKQQPIPQPNKGDHNIGQSFLDINHLRQLIKNLIQTEMGMTEKQDTINGFQHGHLARINQQQQPTYVQKE